MCYGIKRLDHYFTLLPYCRCTNSKKQGEYNDLENFVLIHRLYNGGRENMVEELPYGEPYFGYATIICCFGYGEMHGNTWLEKVDQQHAKKEAYQGSTQEP